MANTPTHIHTQVTVEKNDRLDVMFELQDLFEEMAVGYRFSNLEDDQERIVQFKEMKLAMEAELQEALDEMGWKPWASSRHFNTEAVQSELVDAWHFFMCMCLLANLWPEVLFTKYKAKMIRNIDRQRYGYDGVTEKCPVCHRALDDDHVEKTRVIDHSLTFCSRHCADAFEAANV